MPFCFPLCLVIGLLGLLKGLEATLRQVTGVYDALSDIQLWLSVKWPLEIHNQNTVASKLKLLIISVHFAEIATTNSNNAIPNSTLTEYQILFITFLQYQKSRFELRHNWGRNAVRKS